MTPQEMSVHIINSKVMSEKYKIKFGDKVQHARTKIKKLTKRERQIVTREDLSKYAIFLA